MTNIDQAPRQDKFFHLSGAGNSPWEIARAQPVIIELVAQDVLHCFSDEDRLRYIKSLEYLIKPGGLYIQFCISEKETRPNGGPRYIKKSDLRICQI